MELLAKLLVAGGIMGIIDAIWLTSANSFYRSNLGSMLLEKPNMVAAVAFYVIYVIGIVFFAVSPATDWKHAALLGAMFGFVAYATYDLTNLATLKNFPLKVVLVDLAWGTLLTATVASATYWVVSKL